MPIIVMPKKYCRMREIATARAMIVMPMMAAVILSRASLAPAASPPEVIHWIPPQTRYTKTRIPPMMSNSWAIRAINRLMLVMEKLGGWEKVKGEFPARTGEARRGRAVSRVAKMTRGLCIYYRL